AHRAASARLLHRTIAAHRRAQAGEEERLCLGDGAWAAEPVQALLREMQRRSRLGDACAAVRTRRDDGPAGGDDADFAGCGGITAGTHVVIPGAARSAATRDPGPSVSVFLDSGSRPSASAGMTDKSTRSCGSAGC